jgi:four helix bundle protein
MSWANHFEERLVAFASNVCIALRMNNGDFITWHLTKQLSRSVTSVALNYAEARAAESTNDFIHKMKLCLKELNETKVGLKILSKLDEERSRKLHPLLNEAGELTGIFIASIRTARNKANPLKRTQK